MTNFALREPVEITIRFHDGHCKVLCASVTESGTITYHLSAASGGPPESLSNLQSIVAYPRKMFAGWQDEVISFARGGLGTVVEIR